MVYNRHGFAEDATINITATATHNPCLQGVYNLIGKTDTFITNYIQIAIIVI